MGYRHLRVGGINTFYYIAKSEQRRSPTHCGLLVSVFTASSSPRQQLAGFVMVTLAPSCAHSGERLPKGSCWAGQVRVPDRARFGNGFYCCLVMLGLPPDTISPNLIVFSSKMGVLIPVSQGDVIMPSRYLTHRHTP